VLRLSMGELAQRVQHLDAELDNVVRRLHRITQAVALELVALRGIGPDVASTLLVTAGDNPHRLQHERSFAALCGSSPLPANSGKRQDRHRLNRGGDRRANAALWRIAIVRLSHDQRTRLLQGRTSSAHPDAFTACRPLLMLVPVVVVGLKRAGVGRLGTSTAPPAAADEVVA
jgi:transposase